MHSEQHHSLDPADWDELRAQGHRMLDDIFDYMQNLRDKPVWQPAPQAVRDVFHAPLPRDPSDLAEVHQSFMQNILPYAIGNAHPGFMGWVQGGGTPVGMLAEMLAAGINANVGGRDQIPVEVERQITRWLSELFEFPDTASGIFVTGSSVANLIGVLVGRTRATGVAVRKTGVAQSGKRLIGYTSIAAHACIAQAFDLSGLGTEALRLIPVNAAGQMNLEALRASIASDRANGYSPFFVAGTAGTVDTGSIDDLTTIADIATQENLWFHVDGAYGALAMMAKDLAPRFAGIQRADSIALDFHKWAQVQYDAGFILVRDGGMHYDTFAAPAAYLARETRGMAAGSPWPTDLGPDLSRSFRALKTWFSIKTYGADGIGQVMSRSCALARYLKRRIDAEPQLELLAPVSLNIVCFRYRCDNPDRVNADIAIALQESGIVAPSTTIINGSLALRAALFNHRTDERDVDALIKATLEFGKTEVQKLSRDI